MLSRKCSFTEIVAFTLQIDRSGGSVLTKGMRPKIMMNSVLGNER